MIDKLDVIRSVFGVPLTAPRIEFHDAIVRYRERDALRARETTLSAHEALELGFVDEVISMGSA